MNPDEADPPGEEELPPITEKIQWLFENRWPEDQPASKKKSSRDAADLISAATGADISHSVVWKLRTGRGSQPGRGPNPTYQTLLALARFFKVPFGFFGEDDEAADIGLAADLSAKLRASGVPHEVLDQLADLTQDQQQMIFDMIEATVHRKRERSAEASDLEAS